MRKVILASHGDFAEGIFDSVSMIIGRQENVTVYCMRPGDNASDFAEGLRTEIIAEKDVEFVILTDLFGASVCTAMTGLGVYPNVTVFSGMNLCMILEVLVDYPERLTDQDVEKILSVARNGIRCATVEKQKEEDF